jgi:hypothetical protein
MTTIYNKSGKGADGSKDALVDDDSFGEEELPSDDAYLRKLDSRSATRSRSRRRSNSCLVLSVVLLGLFVLVVCIAGAIYAFTKRSSGSSRSAEKPMIELLLVHYHEWKTGTSGKKDFILEGEFYQQTEIGRFGEPYIKLNVPSLMTANVAVILHDFQSSTTAIIDRDNARCFITPLNMTLVKSPTDFYKIAQNVKAGYDSPDGEVIRDSYRVKMPQMEEVAIPPQIYDECPYWPTYQLERDEPQSADDAAAPVAVSKRDAGCAFKGSLYCLGIAGAPYMQMIRISGCVNN